MGNKITSEQIFGKQTAALLDKLEEPPLQLIEIELRGWEIIVGKVLRAIFRRLGWI